MKNNIELSQIAKWLGGYRVAKLLARDVPRILVYHRFSERGTARALGADVFEKQISWLVERFNIVPLRVINDAVTTGSPIPPNAIVLTVDDGYEDFFTYAFPVLKKYGVPATLYITTEFIDRNIWLWPDVVEYVVRHGSKVFYQPSYLSGTIGYDLATDNGKARAWNDVGDHCVPLDNDARASVLERLADDLRVSVPAIPPQEYGALSWDQLRTLSSSEIEIGAHTCTHANLVAANDHSLQWEVGDCKRRIEEMLGTRVESFCYPNGTRTDLNERVMDVVCAAGYRSATVSFRDIKEGMNPFALGRYVVGADRQRYESVTYGFEYLKQLLKAGLGR